MLFFERILKTLERTSPCLYTQLRPILKKYCDLLIRMHNDIYTGEPSPEGGVNNIQWVLSVLTLLKFCVRLCLTLRVSSWGPILAQFDYSNNVRFQILSAVSKESAVILYVMPSVSFLVTDLPEEYAISISGAEGPPRYILENWNLNWNPL
jgi:hypothetical protein